MQGMTLQGTVEGGQIKLPDHIHLPDNTLVYVVVPDPKRLLLHAASPRLVHPGQAADFEMEVIEASPTY